MRHFPIFVNLAGRRVIVSGAGECAIAKLRLLMKTEAHISVIGTNPEPLILEWQAEGKITFYERIMEQGDALCAVLVYGANEDPKEDARIAAIGRAEGALTNIVDNLQDSQFITPAIVDRDPLTVAIGTEGAAPILARRVKQQLEESLPASIGILARIGQKFRPMADAIPMGRRRRDFWARFYFNRGPKALVNGGEQAVQDELQGLLNETLKMQAENGRVHLVGAGPGDPQLLTLQARQLLHEADVVVHDQLVPQPVLELARREAIVIETGKKGFGPSWKQDDINALLIKHAAMGAHVVRLKSGDPVVFGRLDEEMDALTDAGIEFEIVPGITAASAAAANISQSLTKRDRNSAVRFLTGHDMDGFAEQEWRALSKDGAVSVIYMGKRAAKFVQGRLLMHGADPDTPVTIVENASRPDQVIMSTRLSALTELMEKAAPSGPAVFMLGLSPRRALDTLQTIEIDEEMAEK